MEIRRFGVGHRRHEGPAGTHGVEGQSIHADDRGTIAELAFRPNAAMAPHTNPRLSYFVVIEGGGFVQVGDERARVAAGEAIAWPPDVVHAAWTDQTPMRALVIEFAAEPAEPAALLPATLPETAVEPAPDVAPPEIEPPTFVPNAPQGARPAGGALRVEPGRPPPDRESPEEEPW
jgi:quercetin dioxygenase-like cupin family protein